MKTGYSIVLLVVSFALAREFHIERINDDPYLSYIVPFEPKTMTARAGETVILEVIRCNRTSEEFAYWTTHSLVRNDKTIPDQILGHDFVPVKPGPCYPSDSQINFIPPGTPPGEYHFEGIADSPGLFRRHDVKWFSTTIRVTP